MSIRDARQMMCNGTSAIQNIGGPTLIGDYIDLGAQRDFYDTAKTPDIGEGGNLWLTVKCTTTFVGASTVATVALYHHTAAAVASGAALITSADVGECTAGTTILRQKLPAGTINRYLGICLTIASTNQTAGAIDAWISVDAETPK